MIDWKEIAPKRADWESLTKKFLDRGLKHNWVNGVPEFGGKVSEEDILQALSGATAKTSKPTKKKK